MVRPQSQLQALSKRVFNSLHRLSIVSVLSAERDRVLDVDSIARAGGVPRTAVHTETHLLSDLGVLQRIEIAGRVYYQVIDGPFWEWCETLSNRAAGKVNET